LKYLDGRLADNTGDSFHWNYRHFELVEDENKSKFKVGDIVEVINEAVQEDKHLIGMIGKIAEVKLYGGSITPNYDVRFSEPITLHCNRINDYTHVFFERELRLVSDESESPLTSNDKMDVEKLKTFNPKNLAEGKKQAELEKANYEASESKKAYKELIDQKEEQERKIKVANEELEKINEKLKVFKSK
jgi:hypothetical protein